MKGSMYEDHFEIQKDKHFYSALGAFNAIMTGLFRVQVGFVAIRRTCSQPLVQGDVQGDGNTQLMESAGQAVTSIQFIWIHLV